MYLWVGCKLPEEFESEIREACQKLNEQVGLDTVAFSLPQHISLKISFQTGQWENVLDDLTSVLTQQHPFSVRITGAEQAGSILWMPVADNEYLRQLHGVLDARLEDRFGIPQHEFDKSFKFHSTLFMDADEEKIAQMEHLLSGLPIARELQMDTFLLGVSETRKAGTFRIVREIKV